MKKKKKKEKKKEAKLEDWNKFYPYTLRLC